jgi:hypothetical protein
MIDRRPAVIARCREAGDVAEALRFGRDHGLPMTVRGGGHHVAGRAVCDAGVLLDLSLMKAITVDPTARTATAEPGVTWGELDRATQAYGLATPGGVVSTTGIAGLTLGGGLGWLRRTHGLACDNLLAAEVVLADGRILEVTNDTHADLLWGLRGGGGNLGVVTRFTYLLHPVGPVLMTAAVLYPLEDTLSILAQWRDFALSAPDQVCSDAIGLTVPARLSYPDHLHGRPALLVQAAYFGPLDEGERHLGPLRKLGEPLADLSGPASFVDLQCASDFMYPAHERHYYWKSLFLDGLPEAALVEILNQVQTRSSQETQVIAWGLGGAMARVASAATAFPHRAAPFMVSLDATWAPGDEAGRHLAWAHDAWAALQPHATGTYGNFLSETDQSGGRLSVFGSNGARLAALKERYAVGRPWGAL